MEENFIIDDSAPEMVAIDKSKGKAKNKVKVEATRVEAPEVTNCLRNERVFVKYILSDKDGIKDKEHPYYGGLAETAEIVITVPILTNGAFKNVLTDSEKLFLEEYMGLEYNALSVYKKNDNYWENYFVTLDKMGKILDLSNPNDYIDYKVLLANTDEICPSTSVLSSNPKATYRFVITSDREAYNNTKDRVSNVTKCYKEFGKIEDNFDIMRAVIETITGKPVSSNSDIEFVKSKIVDLIESNPRKFLATVEDKLLPYKVIIAKATEQKIISKRGDYYYYNDEPMCLDGENPTITYAAKFLSLPKYQELKLSIEAKLK